MLASHFVQQICSEYGIPEKNLTDDALAELKKMTWTGNIREFRNVIERLIILCDKKISASDVLTYAAPFR